LRYFMFLISSSSSLPLFTSQWGTYSSFVIKALYDCSVDAGGVCQEGRVQWSRFRFAYRSRCRELGWSEGEDLEEEDCVLPSFSSSALD
jgi:hypothetical protein